MNTMNQITTIAPSAFWAQSYGAFRWDEWLGSKTKQWALISMNLEFDQMRNVQRSHVDCVVNDFGDLVVVQCF
jgi:hypothetical protein